MPREPKRSGFGILLGSLRDNLGETQVAFATRFPVSRSVIANVETGASPSTSFLARLIELFPDQEQAILDAYERYGSHRRLSPSTKRPKNTALQRAEAQITRGQFTIAKRALDYELRTVADDHERFAILEALGRIHVGLNAHATSQEVFAEAANLGEKLFPDDERVLHVWDRLAVALQRQRKYATAHEHLNVALLHHTDAPLLWRRKGIVHWYEHDYSNAYASLTTALELGNPRRGIIHARGQVLAEWGNYDAAVAELDNVLANPTYSPISLAYARSARAYALAKLGDTEQALREFGDAEKITPKNAWLHYFRALCFVEIDEPGKALEGFTRALEAHEPPLNLPKRRRAEEMLRDLR